MRYFLRIKFDIRWLGGSWTPAFAGGDNEGLPSFPRQRQSVPASARVAKTSAGEVCGDSSRRTADPRSGGVRYLLRGGSETGKPHRHASECA